MLNSTLTRKKIDFPASHETEVFFLETMPTCFPNPLERPFHRPIMFVNISQFAIFFGVYLHLPLLLERGKTQGIRFGLEEKSTPCT